jgi:catechol 2,3-dioxygenase-like lactoylglutathione lyase family enzyme
MAIKRMDHVSVIVDDLEAAKAFFVELGMEVEGQAVVSGDWVDRVNALEGVEVEMAMLRTTDGHNKIELTAFRSPTASTAEPSAPVNTIGYRTVMFEVDDIRDTVERMRSHGAELVGEIAQFEQMYLICYLRGPSGIIVALAEDISS